MNENLPNLLKMTPMTDDDHAHFEIIVDFDDLLACDYEQALDLLSYWATGTELLMDINYSPLRVTSDGGLVVLVTGDTSEIDD